MADSSSGFQGYAGPGSFGDESNTSKFETRRAIARISTATLVQVVRAPYDKDGNDIAQGSPVAVGYIDVQPMVNQVDGLGNSMPHAVVYHASYWRHQGGLGAIIVDPAIGDIGKFVSSDRDTSVVKATNQQSNPGSLRRHGKSDGTYFGATQGPLSGASLTTPNQYITFTAAGIIIRDKSGNAIALVSGTSINAPTVGSDPTQSIAFTSDGIKLSDKNGNVIEMKSGGVFINGAQITSAGDVITGDDSVSLDTHVHSGVTTGSGDTGPPVH